MPAILHPDNAPNANAEAPSMKFLLETQNFNIEVVANPSFAPFAS